MDPDTTNCILLGIHVDKKFLAMPYIAKLVHVQGMGVKKVKKTKEDQMLRNMDN